MNLLKQSKGDLIDQIECMQIELDRLQSRLNSQKSDILMAEQKLQRALGYIDHVNEGKDEAVIVQPQQQYIQRGPKLDFCEFDNTISSYKF